MLPCYIHGNQYTSSLSYWGLPVYVPIECGGKELRLQVQHWLQEPKIVKASQSRSWEFIFQFFLSHHLSGVDTSVSQILKDSVILFYSVDSWFFLSSSLVLLLPSHCFWKFVLLILYLLYAISFSELNFTIYCANCFYLSKCIEVFCSLYNIGQIWT